MDKVEALVNANVMDIYVTVNLLMPVGPVKINNVKIVKNLHYH